MTVAFRPRIPTHFSNAADSAEFDFPLADYSFEYEQAMYTPDAPQSGAHGSFDLLRDGVAAKGPGLLRLSFTVYETTPGTVETTVDEMMQKLYSYGRGKLWTVGPDSATANDVERWTYARAMQMPSLRWQGGDILSKGASIAFRTDPFWYGTTALSGSPFTLNSDPDTFTITNGGNAPIYNAVLTLSGTYTNPVIRNTTNGYQLESATDGSSANHLLQFDAGIPRVRKSTNNGSTWSDDYANYVRQSGQVHLMVLDVGDNVFSVTGCSSGALAIAAYPAYH